MNSENKSWKQLEINIDEDLSTLINLSGISKIQSRNPLLQIKRNLLINMIWGFLVCCAYIAMIIFFNYWQVTVAMTMVLAFSIWALIGTLIQYHNLDTKVFSNRPVLQELRRQHQSITSWIRLQSRTAIVIYPVSAAGGFMLGGAVSSGKSVAVFMSKPLMLFIFLVLVGILTPLCHQLARWMSTKSFGKYLDALQKNMEELETEK